MVSAPQVAWFRAPADDTGTLNACYNALDIHVIRGRAEDVALADPGGDWTFARLLTEVAACAGVLRAFGIGIGDPVAIGPVPRVTGVVVALAAARVGAVSVYDDPPTADAAVVVGSTDDGVVLTADAEELPWDIAQRAGRTDPAGCSDVPGDAVLSRHGDLALTVLTALGAADDQGPPVPPGAALVEVGGLAMWSFDAPAAPDRLTR
ncbi:AMP-binding protein [Nocardioides sp.]|uniref:AMP-binding protein n=1 Tax=Nocardioides sp. TaxID=35761 RepID=UPI00262BFA55|nr:AMP-binding protein [Nocardioides sp.]MCW2738596.1 propionyl-CoA synthetase [Nocardioides sp.]